MAAESARFGQGGGSMYRDEEWLVQLMSGAVSDPRYTAKAESELTEIREDGSCIVRGAQGEETIQAQQFRMESMHCMHDL